MAIIKKIISILLVIVIMVTSMIFSLLSVEASSGEVWDSNTRDVVGTKMSSGSSKSGYLESNVWHTTIDDGWKDKEHEFEYQVSAIYYGLCPINVQTIKTSWLVRAKSISTTSSTSLAISLPAGITATASTTKSSTWISTDSRYWENNNAWSSSWRSNAYIYGKVDDFKVENTAYTFYKGVNTSITVSK